MVNYGHGRQIFKRQRRADGRSDQASRASETAKAKMEFDMDATIEERYWQIQFESRVRARYNDRRMRFWEGFSLFAQICEFALSTVAVFALMQSNLKIGMCATSVVATISFVAILVGAGRRARLCAELSAAYTHLECEADAVEAERTESGWNALKQRFAALLAREHETLDCVTEACYLETCASFGVAPAAGWSRLSLFERTVGRWLPVSYTPKPA